VLDAATLFKARAHQVGSGGMDADLSGHIADNGDFVGDLSGLW
jgi:hypothetical protein